MAVKSIEIPAATLGNYEKQKQHSYMCFSFSSSRFQDNSNAATNPSIIFCRKCKYSNHDKEKPDFNVLYITAVSNMKEQIPIYTGMIMHIPSRLTRHFHKSTTIKNCALSYFSANI